MVCLPRASDSPDRRAFPTRRSSDLPSQGWGSEEEIMDPVYSTNAFYDALIEVDGYEAGDINDVAQQVQRSGHPGRSEEHTSELQSRGHLVCRLLLEKKNNRYRMQLM